MREGEPLLTDLRLREKEMEEGEGREDRGEKPIGGQNQKGRPRPSTPTFVNTQSD